VTRTVTQTELQVANEIARRNQDGLEMFRAMSSQTDVVESRHSELGCWGGNRSGKSTISAVKFAAIARNKPIYGPDDQPVTQRLPHQDGRRLLMWIIGLQLNHIGQTIHRLLFRPGLYKMVRDVETQRWRAFNPDTDEKLTTKPSFPLIPWSEVKNVSWANKAARQFEFIELEHADIYAFASTADVKQGDPVDHIWIDERIAIAGHYPEWQARLSDTKGRIIWSSMPRADNGAMLRLNQRAEQQAEDVAQGERKKADVAVVRLRFSSNPHIDDDEKRKRLEGWNEDERKQRDEGMFLTDSIKIFPTFDRHLHRAYGDDPKLDDELAKILRDRNGEPPSHWTREFILDPGTAKPAGLFCAVPPPELWDEGEPYYVPFAELYRPRMDAATVAKESRLISRGESFRRFIIDGKAASQTPMGFSGTVGANYSDHFRKVGFVSEETGESFIPGDPTVVARWQQVENVLRMRKCGRPQLRIVAARCPNLVWQLENNVKAQETGIEGVAIVLEKAAKGQRDDVRHTLEYWISRDPDYAMPSQINLNLGGPGMAAFQRIQKDFGGKKRPENTVYVGPGAVTA
jgi:hypothetical protein